MPELDEPRTTVEVLRRAGAILADRLPPGWTARQLENRSASVPEADGLLEVTAPDGTSVILVLEAKRAVEGRDVPSVRQRLESFLRVIPGSRGVVLARYLASSVRERLIEADLSYVDATGNVYLTVERPGLFISDRGADRDPWRGPGRPRGTLKEAPAAKIVRAVADFGQPWTVRLLVDVAGVSTGAAYRVVDYLEREGLATKDDAGVVSVPDWPALLRRWSRDYGFTRNSRLTRWIAPRGLPNLMERVAGSQTEYAVTGTLAAAEWAAYAPARSAMIYTANAEEAAELWELRPSDAGANVMLAEPDIDVAFARTLTTDADVTIAAPTQVVVDLMTGPGRSPSEAEELLEWMTRNESSWRR